MQQQTQVRDVVLEACNALDTHAERETRVDFGIDAAHLEHVGVNHAATENLEPARALAHAATFAMAYTARHIDLCRRLGEREVVRTEARFAVGAEHSLAEVVERALQIAERDALVDDKALDLGELGQVAGVCHIATVDFARRHDVDGSSWSSMQCTCTPLV